MRGDPAGQEKEGKTTTAVWGKRDLLKDQPEPWRVEGRGTVQRPDNSSSRFVEDQEDPMIESLVKAETKGRTHAGEGSMFPGTTKRGKFGRRKGESEGLRIVVTVLFGREKKSVTRNNLKTWKKREGTRANSRETRPILKRETSKKENKPGPGSKKKRYSGRKSGPDKELMWVKVKHGERERDDRATGLVGKSR